MNLLKAKNILAKGNTICIIKDKEVFVSQESGIKPIVDIIAKNVDIRGASVADKVVGKAAAMLFVYAGVKEVYGQVMSKPALEYLHDKKITTLYGSLTGGIVNRSSTGPCPMEYAVKNVQDEKEAWKILSEKFSVAVRQ